MNAGQRIVHLAKVPRSGFPLCGAQSFNWKLPRQTDYLQLVTCQLCKDLFLRQLRPVAEVQS